MPEGIEAYGGFGDTTSPTAPAKGLYSEAIIRAPWRPHIPYFVLTNGKNDVAPSGTSLLGRVTQLAIPRILNDKEDEQKGMSPIDQIEDYLFADSREKAKNVTGHCFKERFPITMGDIHVGLGDRRLGIEDTVPEYGIRISGDGAYMYWSCDQDWIQEALNRIQYDLTELFMQIKIRTFLEPVGYGAFRLQRDTGQLRLVPNGRPGRFVEFGEGNVAEYTGLTDPYTTTQKANKAAYLYASALTLRALCKGDRFSPDLNLSDYAAQAQTDLYNYKGFGDIKVVQNFAAGTIADRVLHHVGVGISQANIYLPRMDDINTWGQYIRHRVIFGCMEAQFSAESLVSEINRIRGHFMTMGDQWKIHNRVPLESYGSDGPYFVMPFNAPQDEFYLPVVMDRKRERPNKYVINRLITNLGKTISVEVKHAEVEGNPFDPASLEQIFVRPTVHDDVRIRTWNPQQRHVMRWEIPMWRNYNLGTNNGNGDGPYDDREIAIRSRLLVQGWRTNLPQVYADGYVVEWTGFVHRIEGVRWRVTKFGDTVLVLPDGRTVSQRPGAMESAGEQAHAAAPVQMTPSDAVPVNEQPVTPIQPPPAPAGARPETEQGTTSSK